MRFVLIIFLVMIHNIIYGQDVIIGRTTGNFPFLEFGLGDDRLGGAKMTFLDSNVLVKVVDSFNNDYKVRLSSNHYAFLSKQFFMPDTTTRDTTMYLSASWRIWGDDQYDYLTISLPERLPYRSVQQIDPSRIVIDVFGLTSNTNWITQLKTVEEIKNAWYEQVEDDVYRVYIELKHQQHWGYLISYNKNVLRVRINRQPNRLKLKGLKLAIDAGHGGDNKGATGLTSGVSEKEYTLKIAEKLQRELLRKGAEVFMTRTSDSTISMEERLLMLRQQAPDLLISIHLNSSSNKNIQGVSTYYRYIGFRSLSENILDRMLEMHLNNFGNIGAFNFSLSGPTEFPNCLVEVAFLSNEEDEKKILDDKFQKKAAKKIRQGIEDWLEECRIAPRN